MASLAANEPMAQRHGIFLWSSETTWGTPVTPATGGGIATLAWEVHANPQYIRGPGSPDPITMRPGETFVSWTLTFEAIQTGMKNLLLKVQRASGVCPPFTLGLGRADDAGTPVVAIDQIAGCKVEKLTLAGDVSGGHRPITGSMSGWGTAVTRLTAGAAAILTTTPWMTQDVVFTRAGAAYPVRSWTADLSNTISKDYVMPGATATNPRLPAYATEHGRDFTGSITRYAESSVAMQAATLAEFAQVAVITNPVDSVALTLTWANVAYANEKPSIGRDGQFYSEDYTARGLVLS